MRLYIQDLRDIAISRELDSGADRIEIDISAWRSKYRQLVYYRVEVTNAQGVSYIARTEMEGDVLVWPISASDTVVSGLGHYQIVAWGMGDERKTSPMRTFRVEETLHGMASETPPDAWEPFAEGVAADATRAEQAAQRAEDAADRAENAGGDGGGGTSEPGQDGYSPTATVQKVGKTATITITDKNGTTTAQVHDGKDGSPGKDGAPGQDGFSPVVAVQDISGGHRVTITDKDGAKQFDVMDGQGGTVEVDETLTQAGMAADAAAVGERIEGLYEEIAELKGEGEVTVENVTFVPDIDGYLAKDGVTINGATTGTSFHTDYIPLDGYDRVSAKTHLTQWGYAIAFFDSNKTILPDISILGHEDIETPLEIDAQIPAGASYVMVSVFVGAANTYSGWLKLSRQTSDNRVDNPLYGKKIAFLGDSITSTAYGSPNYWQRIAEKTGMIPLNYSLGQSRIATVDGDDRESFVTRAAAMDASADAVLVMGGTNDVGLSTLLGEWDSEDVSTFYGALNALIALLRTNYPGKPIVFCTPIKRKYDTDNGFPDTMADLKAASATEQITMQHCALAIKAKCARHGIPAIDLAEHSGISPETPEYYYSETDNLHPSALGHVRIANMVQAELEKQFLHTAD